MTLETINENLCVNKIIAIKKEIIIVEGDVIVPDSKPDILNTICTSGVVCLYKKEVLDAKVRIDGCVNTYIMYVADSQNDKIRGINTSLDFSEIIPLSESKDGIDTRIKTKLRTIECKVINGRKIGVKAGIEVEVILYSKEDVEIVNGLQEIEGIQILKDDLYVNSLVGTGTNKIYTKETISINNVDNLGEILKVDIKIVDKEVKVSYNKILTKAEARVKILYLTEDNRINIIDTKIPVVGFIDIPNVTENSICDLEYEIKNLIIKPNSSEEHSIYIELEVEVNALCYEEKQINLIQDLYSTCENLEFNKKEISTIKNKQIQKGIKQIRENIQLEGIENRELIDIDISPIIEKQEKFERKILYTGKVEMNLIFLQEGLQIDVRNSQIPFEYVLEGIENIDSMNCDLEIEVANQDFVIQDGGIIKVNIDLNMNNDIYQKINLNLLDEIETNGERKQDDYSMVVYIVKKGDSLWKIAKKYGCTTEDISRVNEIEDENVIDIGKKLFIPRYNKVGIKNE